jgi:hypothetical protein
MSENNHDIRRILPSGEGLEPTPLGQLPPGVGPPPDSFNGDTHAALDGIGTHLAAAEIAVYSHLLDKTTEIAASIADAEATVIGHIDKRLDNVQAAINKVYATVVKNIAVKMGSAVEYLAPTGIDFTGVQTVPISAGTRGPTFSGGVPSIPSQPIPIEQQLGGPGGIPQPTGNIIPMPLSGCPDGWSQFQDAHGAWQCVEGIGCAAGWHLDFLPNRGWACVNNANPALTDAPHHIAPQLPPGNVPPSDDTQPPLGEPPPATVPPTAPPIAFDGDSCTYARRPTVKTGSGCLPIPGPPPPPTWVVTYCDGCKVCYDVYSGDDPPSVSEGHTVSGPIHGTFNLEQYVNSIVCAEVASPPGEGDGNGGPEESECGDGQHIDEATGECVDDEPADEHQCPEGFEWDEESEQCVGAAIPPVPPVEPPAPVPAPAPPPIPQPQPGQDVCDLIEDSLRRLGAEKCDLSKMFGLENQDGEGGGFWTGFFGGILGAKSETYRKIIVATLDIFCNILNKSIEGAECNRGQLMAIEAFLAGLRFVNRWTGLIPAQIVEQLTILSRTVCQSRLPGGGMADVAWLRGTIDDKTWECFHKAEGNHLGPAAKIRDAGRAKPDPSQLDKLHRRKLLEDAAYDKLMREAGVIKDEDKKNISNLNVQFPTHSEIISLLIRDVFDEVNIDWKESDRIFEQKYVGQAKDWFDANGIPKEMAKLFWRGHWHIPSYSMGQHFLFRQRPGKDGVDKPFTENDFREMLLQDDWAPQFIDHMIATAYKVPTRRDIIMAFMNRTLSDEGFKGFLQDMGYKPDGAEFFLSLYKAKRQKQEMKDAGYPSIRQLANSFARCEMSSDEFKQAIQPLVVTEEQIEDATEAARLSRALRQRRDAIAAIRRPYVLGIIDNSEVRERLSEAGIDGACQDEYIQNWDLLAAKQDKQESASTLCGMLEIGVVSPTQFVDALVRQHWSVESSLRILQQCEFKINEKEKKKAEALARRILSEQRRAEKEAAKRRRLLECGPPKCPSNTPGGSLTSGAGQSSQGRVSNGTASTTPTAQ